MLAVTQNMYEKIDFHNTIICLPSEGHAIYE